MVDAITAADLTRARRRRPAGNAGGGGRAPTATATSSSRSAATSTADLARLDAHRRACSTASREPVLRLARRQRAVRRAPTASPSWWRACAQTPALARLWRSILFIEQPIARKRRAATPTCAAPSLGKPVIIDESDGELDAFVQARARGYAGVSSKTCKGFYKSLLNAARCAAWNARAGAGALLHVGRRPDDAGRPVGAAGPGAGQPAGHHARRAQRPPLRQRHGGAAGRRSSEASSTRIPTSTSAATARCACASATAASRLGSLDCAGFASAAMPDFEAMAPLAG